MKSNISTFIVLALLTGWAFGEVPRKAPLTKYQGLWTNSPFTTKPPIGDGGPPPPNPLDDYALAGVSPVKGGYRVTIINKKKPEERKYVYSDQEQSSHGFKILSVERDAKNVRGTVVHMMSGSQKGTVSYDDKLLTISTPAPAQQPPQAKGQGNPQHPTAHGAAQVPHQPGAPAANPQGQPAQPGGVRAPRPRVIGPPPMPQTPATPQNNPSTPAERPLRR